MSVFRNVMVLWVAAILSVGGTARSDEIRFVEGLRQRRLFPLAVAHCRQQLAEIELDDATRADLTLELIRTFAAQALHAPPADREALWDQARQTAADFQRLSPRHPRRLLVRVQDALTLLARGESHRQESEVLADPLPAVEAARAVLRDATRLLQQIGDDVAREIPLRHRQTPAGGELTADELISLQHQLQFHLARAYRNRALCYPPGSEDRVAALTGAVEQLNKPLLQIRQDDPLIWPIRLDLAVCFRLLGQGDEAERILQMVADSEAPAEIRLRARAEEARLQLDRQRPQEALRLLQQGRQLDGKFEADLDYAHLEICLALWQAAMVRGDEPEADRWRKRAVQVVQLIEQTHGPYWGRRGDLLLVRSVGHSQAAGDLDILARTADELYRQGQWDEAVTAYEQAAAGAHAAGEVDRSFQLRYQAALVHHTRDQHPQAAQRLRRLAIDLPTQEHAARAHLLAAWNAAQLARSVPQALETYSEILQEHLRQWPASGTADTARIWLGRLRENRSQWQAAAEAYQAVSREDDRYDASLSDAARCWTNALDEAARAAGSAPAEMVAAAVAAFQDHTPASSETAGGDWTPTARFCAGQAARWLIAYASDGYARAEDLLTAALAGPPPPELPWQADAEALLIVALAGQPARRSLAEQRLQNAVGQSPDRLLDMLRGLAPLSASADPPACQELARLQLAVADRLWEDRDQLEPAELLMLRRVRAAALVSAGRTAAARQAYRELARDDPDDGDVQQAYAQLLLDADDRPSWQQALEVWRQIAARSPPRSDRWYQSRWAIAAALVKLGQGDEAARRIRYLQALPPGLQDTGWEARFQELLRQAEAGP